MWLLNDTTRAELVALAAGRGVTLTPVPGYPGLEFAYLPTDLSRSEVHLSLFAYNWRLQAVDAPNSYCAHWCYAGIGEDTFCFAVDRLRAWDGDRAGEPTGYLKAYDRRASAAWNWSRPAGRLMNTATWEEDFKRERLGQWTPDYADVAQR